MKRIFTSKKGSWSDSIYIFFFFIFIVFLALIFLKVIGSFNDDIQDSDVAIEGKNLLANVTQDVRDRADNTIILFLFILIVGSWISSFFLDNHPMYFVFFFVMSFISFFIMLPIANVAYNFQFDVSFIDQIQYLEKTFFVIDNFAAFMAFYLVSTALVLYGKNKFATQFQKNQYQ